VQTRCGSRHVEAETCAPRLDRCAQAVARRDAEWAARIVSSPRPSCRVRSVSSSSFLSLVEQGRTDIGIGRLLHLAWCAEVLDRGLRTRIVERGGAQVGDERVQVGDLRLQVSHSLSGHPGQRTGLGATELSGEPEAQLVVGGPPISEPMCETGNVAARSTAVSGTPPSAVGRSSARTVAARSGPSTC
jgi:hypothetical protein